MRRHRKPYYSRMPDEDLVALAREGDRPATDYILHKYRGLVEGKARAYFLPGAERADVVQEGMIGLYKAIRDYRSGHLAAFRSFAETCVTRQIITATKMASRKKHGLLNACTSIDWLCDENGGEPGNWLHSRISCTCPSAEEVVLGEVAAREIDRRMRVMLSRLETIAIRAYLSGRSYHEIAELENLSPKQVDNALQRAKRKLKCRMSPAALA